MIATFSASACEKMGVARESRSRVGRRQPATKIARTPLCKGMGVRSVDRDRGDGFQHRLSPKHQPARYPGFTGPLSAVLAYTRCGSRLPPLAARTPSARGLVRYRARTSSKVRKIRRGRLRDRPDVRLDRDGDRALLPRMVDPAGRRCREPALVSARRPRRGFQVRACSWRSGVVVAIHAFSYADHDDTDRLPLALAGPGSGGGTHRLAGAAVSPAAFASYGARECFEWPARQESDGDPQATSKCRTTSRPDDSSGHHAKPEELSEVSRHRRKGHAGTPRESL
jgi:hypothetical protein